MSPPQCKNLVLDAGPLLSLSPLRGLAETYFTVPQVLSELKDHRAREHFERLGLMSGVKVEVRSPSAASLAYVIQWAKKTGDYSVLSHPDLCVLALTHALDEEDKRAQEISVVSDVNGISSGLNTEPSHETSPSGEAEPLIEADLATPPEGLSVGDILSGVNGIQLGSQVAEDEEESLEKEQNLEGVDTNLDISPTQEGRNAPSPIYDDPSDSDDGEGEWITPSNAALHKSRALELLPADDVVSKKKGKGKEREPLRTGCMTADFAMQNVLLQMGLNLVGLEGKRIEKVKSWVLRCHACFKICKDNSKKFCPSCGNATLLRASVTVASPTAYADAPAMQVHLKPNFQYKIRGTKYPIPAPKQGSAKFGAGTGLVLREDQVEYLRAKKKADGKREREEVKLLKGILAKGVDSNGASATVGSWMDPDWVPEIMSVGSGGKGRSVRNSRMDGDLPQIGYGRKNPNEKRRNK
ncbi:uncharacterized protein LACBIDRAFT_311593 [Laccaria bicolor S238N-H82]|uniref:20S-pre-rRNA D-site endonuclease NOB1 n=1 Tax=Laccaria bicolor (strain S238N-H82 / ATCC MYA-4686) TaxID=486041 RepID=B0CXS3_LACBS|nr:uncharacterized protein LACBIDRAFT_311593 [Laccaria bicolor S238N-H82]EDR12773.1 predicted protein [Laccaria bicolor S238N-H82]|eukprot:XP_001877037.1 predicted protein [Laccaria bicolor S238N-H82]